MVREDARANGVDLVPVQHGHCPRLVVRVPQGLIRVDVEIHPPSFKSPHPPAAPSPIRWARGTDRTLSISFLDGAFAGGLGLGRGRSGGKGLLPWFDASGLAINCVAGSSTNPATRWILLLCKNTLWNQAIADNQIGSVTLPD